jgi:hypothetical protein
MYSNDDREGTKTVEFQIIAASIDYQTSLPEHVPPIIFDHSCSTPVSITLMYIYRGPPPSF